MITLSGGHPLAGIVRKSGQCEKQQIGTQRVKAARESLDLTNGDYGQQQCCEQRAVGMVLSPMVSDQPKVICHQMVALASVSIAALLHAFLSVLLEGSYPGESSDFPPPGALWLLAIDE